MRHQSKHTAVWVALLLFMTAGCAEEETAALVVKKKVRVQTNTITGAPFVQKITLPGTSRAYQEVSLQAEIAGRVTKIAFEKGERVKKGRPLVYLDDSQLRANLRQAKAARDLAELDYQKYKTLQERQAAVSSFELERSRLNFEAAEASYQSLEAVTKKSVIQAPFGGTMVNRLTEVGAIVGPGTPLGRIVSLHPLKVEFGVPEAAITDFVAGKQATVTFEAFPGQSFTGQVTFVSPEVNQADRTFPGEITLANKKGTLFPQMSARITMTRKERQGAILIPQTAVLELSNGKAVFVVDQENIARQRPVVIGDYADEQALIIQGLAEGDQLVTIGHRSLLDGDAVEIVK